jgi:SAM-dependent methyltransferase
MTNAPLQSVVLRTTRNRLAFALAWQWGWMRFQWLVRIRRTALRSYGEIDRGTAGVQYSRNYFARYSPDARIFWNMFLLTAIPDVRKDSLLVIGPRYETELLIARSLGFRPSGLRGLDTHSYSPLIDVGDMHAMPYGDRSFSNIICGWTLSYSVRPEVACAEMARVLAPGGYLILSVQKVAPDFNETIEGVLRPAARIQTLASLDALFPSLRRVAGFEPSVVGQSSHTLAAYSKPGEGEVQG